MFKNRDIRQTIQMKSDYSRRIYLLLKERKDFGERSFIVDDLMMRLEVPKSYKVYADFKRRVLEQAVIDINAYTDIEITYEEHKRLRKIHKITFNIKGNQEDLNSFIRNIRECYANEKLFKSNTRDCYIKCSKQGVLYYADESMATLDKESSLKAWKWMHENKKTLLCYGLYG